MVDMNSRDALGAESLDGEVKEDNGIDAAGESDGGVLEVMKDVESLDRVDGVLHEKGVRGVNGYLGSVG